MSRASREEVDTLAGVHEELGRLAKELAARLPGVTFGYIGNCGVDRSGPFDDRSWRIFLPHPGRVGTWEDCVGGYRTENLGEMLRDWPDLAHEAEKRMARRTAAEGGWTR